MQGRLEHAIECEAKAEEMLKDMPDFVKEYYSVFKQGRQPSAVLNYIRYLGRFLRFVNEDTKNITIEDLNSNAIVSSYMNSINTTIKGGEIRETSMSYRQSTYAVLNSFYSFLTDNDYIEKNPIRKIKRTKGKDIVTRKFLTERDLRRILAAADVGVGSELQIKRNDQWRHRDKAILMLFMETGMRCTALSEINVSDVDLNKGTISVINKGHKPFVYKIEGKLVEALLLWIRDRKEFLKDKEMDALFVSDRKKRITSRTISRLVEKYSEDALGYSISPHKLRAAYANIILRKSNGNIYLTQRLLDHASPNTTKIYLDDISEEDKDMATQMISNAIF